MYGSLSVKVNLGVPQPGGDHEVKPVADRRRTGTAEPRDGSATRSGKSIHFGILPGDLRKGSPASLPGTSGGGEDTSFPAPGRR